MEKETKEITINWECIAGHSSLSKEENIDFTVVIEPGNTFEDEIGKLIERLKNESHFCGLCSAVKDFWLFYKDGDVFYTQRKGWVNRLSN